MKGRIAELDFLKCIFILLMIVFHLAYIGDKYPYAKSLVYTFHMPAFLIISGYLMNVEKEIRPFLRMIVWIFIPYAVMESGYVIVSSVLPVRGGVDELGWGSMAGEAFPASGRALLVFAYFDSLRIDLLCSISSFP